MPSGVSYMLANRKVIKRVFPSSSAPTTFAPSITTRRRCWPACAQLAPAHVERPRHRRAHARQLQLGLLRAHVPGAGDGRRAGRRARPLRPRQRRLHADHRRAAARRRDLPAARRRLPRSADVPARLAARRGRAVQRLPRRATSRSPTRWAPASPTTRRSTRTCRRSSGSTSARTRSCPTSRPSCCEDAVHRQHVLGRLDEMVVKPVGESGGYGMLIGPHSTAAQREEFRQRILANPRNYIAQPTMALSMAPVLRRRPRSSRATSTSARTSCAAGAATVVPGRPDAGGPAARVARRQLLPGRRQQGHLGARAPDGGTPNHALTSRRQPLLDEPLPRAGGAERPCDWREPRAQLRSHARTRRRGTGASCLAAPARPARSEGDAGRTGRRGATCQPALDHACVTAARENVRQVRENVSSEMWERVERAAPPAGQPGGGRRVHLAPARVLPRRAGGRRAVSRRRASETMTRGEGWDFMQIGLHVERATATARLLGGHFTDVEAAWGVPVPLAEYLEWSGLLRSCCAFEAYCRRHTAELAPRPRGRLPAARSALPAVDPVRVPRDLPRAGVAGRPRARRGPRLSSATSWPSPCARRSARARGGTSGCDDLAGAPRRRRARRRSAAPGPVRGLHHLPRGPAAGRGMM